MRDKTRCRFDDVLVRIIFQYTDLREDGARRFLGILDKGVLQVLDAPVMRYPAFAAIIDGCDLHTVMLKR